MYQKNKIIIIFSLVLVGTLSSCLDVKKITYFQKGVNGTDTVGVHKEYIAKIQSGDILSIYVNSLSPQASSYFNPYSANVVTPEGGGSGSSLSESAASGFLVDGSGKINIPLIGPVQVAGLSTSAVTDTLTSKLKVYLKDPTVSVRFLNYKISILGEVNKPGVYVVPNEKITIAEAITLAGDLTSYSRRDNIQVIRDINGKKEFGEVSLTDRSVFLSPYYYLRANDIVYVKPGKNKVAQSDVLVKLLPIIISATSLLIVIIDKL
jgi:polysaccharide export outer membrane protein